jgi:hypothetical protein
MDMSEVTLNLVPRKKEGRKNLCSRRDRVAKLISGRNGRGEYLKCSGMVAYLSTDWVVGA